MDSMNNWLGFSLSHQQQQQQQQQQDHSQNSVLSDNQTQLGFNSDELLLSAGGGGGGGNSNSDHNQCFDLITSDDSTTLPPAAAATPFSIFQAFNSNPHHSQDNWNMNSYSCSPHQNQETPKLENFLGVHGGQTHFTDHYHINGGGANRYTPYQEAEPPAAGNNSTMGLSMIKNWLRNNSSNPLPPPTTEAVDNEAAVVVAGGGGAQTLSLSMSTGGGGGSQSSDNNKLHQSGNIESVPRKSIETFGQRTSIYRGVTRHRWTGRYEAHLWDNSCRREGQTRKGRQVYLGGYDKEDKAARAYDLAALKYWGTTTTTNCPISNYEKEIEEMKHMTRQEFIASLRRKSSGFSRGASIYRGVTRHHQHGRWQARIGRVAGNKDLYLGTFSTQEEAAEAYDIAAIKFRGLNAVTNFEINRYDVKSILESTTLPIGGAAKRLKDAENAEIALQIQRAEEANSALTISNHIYNMNNISNGVYGGNNNGFQSQSQPLIGMYPYGSNQRLWCKQEQHDSGFHDIHNQQQLQLGNYTQNFLQPSSVLHNLMSMDSNSSVEQSSDSNAGVYGNGFTMPMMNPIAEGGFEESVFGGSSYNQHARSLYYQQSSSPPPTGVPKNGIYNSASDHNNNGWIPTAVPTTTFTNFRVRFNVFYSN
ncbi:hypothetical protein MIMGU_mgv1a027130mg [Erythranthe guttata]|uniref:AP2/ERF domain-containing protein n=1 Tax=Erythranthe guttata TaxID=4155 RepID=A0A022RLD1_ERYGU|nr:hypothetical protein MIMGU_mgv1a027130mg [Erythranthe guttata]